MDRCRLKDERRKTGRKLILLVRAVGEMLAEHGWVKVSKEPFFKVNLE